MQGTQVSRAVTYLGQIWVYSLWCSNARYSGIESPDLPWPNIHTRLCALVIPDCVLWLRGQNRVARIGEMHDQDFVPMTSGIESRDCVSLTLVSRRRKVGLPLPQIDRPFGCHFPGKESRLPFG